MEYEVQAEVEYTFRRAMPISGAIRRSSDAPEFYDAALRRGQGPVTTGDLILMDVGAEYEHLSPMSPGRFP